MGLDRDDILEAAAGLRRRAEELLGRGRGAGRLVGTDDDSRMLHELQVHQIELEMQNAELRQSRDAMEKALEEYTDLYDFAPVGYLTLDRQGTIRAANLTVTSILGIERARLIGRSFEAFVAKEASPVVAQLLQEAFENQARYFCEVMLPRAGMDPLIVQVEAALDSSREECRVAIINISGRKQLEKNLEILRTDLAARAAELESANIALEAFNYSVAHDLRRPLTVIQGYCEILLDLCRDRLDEQSKGYIREIVEGALRMNGLIDTLLKFSHVTRTKIHHEKVDLSALAREVALGLTVSAPERRVTFLIAEGITASGDPGLLRVVLDNLIGNAWKFAGNREGTVIEFGATEVDGKSACFVRDNGPGFDMAMADRLFLAFQRLPGASVEGHGIGLAMVERVVRRHDGRVWAESRPGEGATFFFTLGQLQGTGQTGR